MLHAVAPVLNIDKITWFWYSQVGRKFDLAAFR